MFFSDADDVCAGGFPCLSSTRLRLFWFALIWFSAGTAEAASDFHASKHTLFSRPQRNVSLSLPQQSCTISFVVFLVVAAEKENSTSLQLFTEAEQLFDSIDLAHPRACKFVLTDGQTKFPHDFPPSVVIKRIVTLPQEALQQSGGVRRYVIAGCSVRMLPYAVFLRDHAIGHTVFLDSDILLLSTLQDVFDRVDFDIGLTLTWAPSSGLEPNPKTINCGVIFAHASNLLKSSIVLERVALHSCTFAPQSALPEQMALHHMVLDGQAHNVVVRNLNVKDSRTCLRVSFPPQLRYARLLFLQKHFNCEATKAGITTRVMHFTGRRKFLMAEFHSQLMQEGAKGIKRTWKAKCLLSKRCRRSLPALDPTIGYLKLAANECEAITS